jgi:hypothetical protein
LPEWFHEIKYGGYRLRIERDEIAARQLHTLQKHQRPAGSRWGATLLTWDGAKAHQLTRLLHADAAALKTHRLGRVRIDHCVTTSISYGVLKSVGSVTRIKAC